MRVFRAVAVALMTTVVVAVAIPSAAATPPVGSFPDLQKTAPGEFTAYFSD